MVFNRTVPYSDALHRACLTWHWLVTRNRQGEGRRDLGTWDDDIDDWLNACEDVLKLETNKS